MTLKVQTYKERIGVAVSGGIDSMVLLHAFLSAGQDILAVNIEHGIRGEASLRDTDFVKNYCRLNNIPFVSFSINAPAHLLPGESLETGARRMRYEIFDKLLADGKVKYIALAHHADDNAETVLMRLFRGTGIRGLSGITNRGSYIRPFIRYTRGEIEEYAGIHSVPFVNDETNAENDYTRNFIRNELLPLIKLKYPDVSHSIARLSESAAETDDYLQSVCPKAVLCSDGRHLDDLFGYPKILQKYAIMQTIREMGFLQDFETRHLDAVIGLESSLNNTCVDLPFGLTAVRYENGVIIAEKQTEKFTPKPFNEKKEYYFAGRSYRFEPGTKIMPGITFDPKKLPEGTVVRTRKNGDIFKRVNGKTKLLSDFLNEKKLSKPEKDALLVLAKGKEIFAVLGIETAEAVKITDTTEKILYIIRE